MKAAERVRLAYERQPYPFGNHKALKHSSWRLSHDWINSMGRDGPRENASLRVLLAGCGAGSEAFRFRRELPGAEIVAFDFSARSIALAKRLQRRGKLRDIRFLVADLTDPKLGAALGGKFDLITCHGVLSYVPSLGRAMKNLARCLKPDGVLYLGVNGSGHVNVRLRKVLTYLGFDVERFEEGPRVRSVLRLCDAVQGPNGSPSVSGLCSAYVASDVFGPINTSLTLEEWVLHGRRAGLHFRGAIGTIVKLRRLADGEHHARLIPRSRADVARFIETLSPSQFLRLMFSLTPEANPPWGSKRLLMKWSMAPTLLYSIELPRATKPIRDRLGRVRIKSPDLNLSTEWQMPEWEMELLRPRKTLRPLGSIFDEIPLAVPFAELRKQIYLLYQLGIVNLTPPLPQGAAARRP